MDGITEPVILILGHPIAGNPAQFALERSLKSLELEWRVLSSEVAPENVDQAIAGGEVLGFRGMLLDDSLAFPETDEAARPNCLYRDPESDAWRSEDALTSWFRSIVQQQVDSLEDEMSPMLWIGPVHPRFPSDIPLQQNQSPIAWASPELVAGADVIAITKSIDVGDWPACERSTLVIDLAAEGNDTAAIGELGYNVITSLDMMIGTLAHCVERWTGQKPSVEILAEAIEEYLAV